MLPPKFGAIAKVSGLFCSLKKFVYMFLLQQVCYQAFYYQGFYEGFIIKGFIIKDFIIKGFVIGVCHQEFLLMCV